MLGALLWGIGASMALAEENEKAKTKSVEEQLEYAKIIIQDLLNNSDEVTGTWNGAYFRGEIHHASGDPFPKVVAWRPMEEPNLGAPFYTKCLGECRD